MWGLLRSLPFTIDSFHRNILGPLQFANHTYDLFLHSYFLSEPYNNLPAGEFNVIFNQSDWELLSPQYVYIENQTDFDERIRYDLYSAQGDPWRNGFVSMKNHLRALNSLHHVTQVVQRLIETGQRGYDAILFIRPDVKFLNPLPMALVSSIPLLSHNRNTNRDFSRTIFVSDFHRSCQAEKHEINDRFALTTLQAGLIYGNRLEEALLYSQHSLLHSESFLGYTLLHSHSHSHSDGQRSNKQVTVIEIPFYFQRIRYGGRVNPRDLLLPHQVTGLADENNNYAMDETKEYQYHVDREPVEYSLYARIKSTLWIWWKWLIGYDAWYRWSREVFCRPHPLRITYRELAGVVEPSSREIESFLVSHEKGFIGSLAMDSIHCTYTTQDLTLSVGEGDSSMAFTERDNQSQTTTSRVITPHQCSVTDTASATMMSIKEKESMRHYNASSGGYLPPWLYHYIHASEGSPFAFTLRGSVRRYPFDRRKKMQRRRKRSFIL
jgi:hypothetical protein